MNNQLMDPSGLLSRLELFKNDPISIFETAVQMLGSVSNINPGHPFVLGIEMASVLTSAAFNECLLASRRPYVQLAQTEQDAYLHMTDDDYIGRFAVPANTSIRFWINEAEFLNLAKTDPVSGVKKVVIPRHSSVTVLNTTFTFVYPVEIVQLKSGAIRAYYDMTTVSPMLDLPSNEITIETLSDGMSSFMVLNVKVLQMSIKTHRAQASGVSDVSEDISFEDQFYTARAFIKKNGKWTEVKTTHSDLTYNPKEPTVVFKVTEGNLNVSLPQVYYNTKDASGERMVDGDIRIDVYTTKGAVTMSLADYDITSFSARFIDLDDTADTTFWKPVLNFRTMIMSSKDVVSGGRAALTFDQLIERIRTNSIGPRLYPLNDAQVEAKVADLGYTVTRTVDNVNTRTFIAVKNFPAPSEIYPIDAALPKAQTAISGTIQTAYFIMDNLASLPGVIDNGKYVTLSSSMLLRTIDGNVTFVTQNDIARLRSLSPAELTQEISYGNYLFTPFHYVLDRSDPNAFSARAYYLDKPTVEGKSFVAQNNSSGLHVTTASYSLAQTANGYVLLVVTKSSPEYQAIPNANLFTQLCFKPTGEQGYACINGTLVSVDPSTFERTYAFELKTSYVIDSDDNIHFNNFNLYGTASPSVRSPLANVFTVIYGVAGAITNGWQPFATDAKLDLSSLPQTSHAITEEAFHVRFGNALTDLWQKTRVVPSPQNYKKYTEDVYQTYPNDIYEVFDANGTTVKVNQDGSITRNLLHKAGDFVLDALGNKQILHHAGEVVLTDGKPVLVSDRQLLRQVDLFALEGSYRFATAPVTVKYKEDFIASLVKWITQDLEAVSNRLIDQSRIYFSPKKAVGYVTVIGPDNQPHVVEAAHSFVVTLYVDASVKNNPALKSRIETSVVSSIAKYMDRTELNLLDLKKFIKENAGSEVISLDCTGFGPGYSIVSILDPTFRLSVRKRLAYNPDTRYDVVDDVTCNFVEHQVQN